MFSILLAILFRPSVLIFLGLLIAAGVGIFFWKGPKALLSLVLDGRVWLVVLGFSTFLAVADLKKANEDLKQEVEQQALVIQGKNDAAATIEYRQQVREQRATESETIRDATTQAAVEHPEEVIDATLDAIAQVQAGNLDGRHPSESAVDSVLDGKRPDGNVAP